MSMTHKFAVKKFSKYFELALKNQLLIRDIFISMPNIMLLKERNIMLLKERNIIFNKAEVQV
jgi:hypothetical protein